MTYPSKGENHSAVGEVGLVARTGGDEFVILMPVEPRRIEQTVVNIHHSISRPAGRQSISVSVGASAWLASTIPDASGTIDRILADADNAMYRAKRRGGDQVAWAVTHLS
ncbi:diguanylate cyclase [Rhodococcus sp. IEGM 1409]|uniref:diguanylate cyclase domain-containing protein n=1 Tax=Rhodococcus sp. IEGM 1409 TaxID=3047082 RepID=UPI0024B8097E|nr:diguanylate cyclase [Rhodococcus sp. IEGM 1409]MDI9901711.1 diguanylate cyclase [Rhodococcus sp. IEGM 1409]